MRPYFVCPVTGLDCLKLFIMNGMICSKTAFDPAYRAQFSGNHLSFLEARRKLLKQDGSARIGGLERERLLATVEKHPERYRSDAALFQLIERNKRRQARDKAKFLWESRALSTTKGLDCGRGIVAAPDFRGICGQKRLLG